MIGILSHWSVLLPHTHIHTNTHTHTHTHKQTYTHIRSMFSTSQLIKILSLVFDGMLLCWSSGCRKRSLLKGYRYYSSVLELYQVDINQWPLLLVQLWKNKYPVTKYIFIKSIQHYDINLVALLYQFSCLLFVAIMWPNTQWLCFWETKSW